LSAGAGHSPLPRTSIQIQLASIFIEKNAKYFPRHESYARIANFQHFLKKSAYPSGSFLYLYDFVQSSIHWEISKILSYIQGLFHPLLSVLIPSHSPSPLKHKNHHLLTFCPPLNTPEPTFPLQTGGLFNFNAIPKSSNGLGPVPH
jgi:hypothetical protein